MAFVKKTEIKKEKKPWLKSKGARIALALLFSIILVMISVAGYTIATSSKVFENGLSGTGIIKTLYGKEKLQGEDQDRINILVMGMGGVKHPGGLLTDSMMLVSIKPSTNKAVAMSIPRDLAVQIKGYGENKINSAFSDGYQDYLQSQCKKTDKKSCTDDAMAAGAKKTVETVSTTFNQPINYYVTLDFSGFENIIDKLGGVDVYVEKTINDPRFPAADMVHYSPFKLSAGWHHLDGTTALKYARSRETTSDFDRSSRQQNLLKALQDKMNKSDLLTNPKKLLDLINTLSDSVRTNFTPSELKTFAEMARRIPGENISTKVLDNSQNGPLMDYNNGTYLLKPRSGNFKELQRITADIFDQPETAPKIELLNGSKTSGIASKVKTALEDDGYPVASLDSAKEKVSKTIIYDASNGKKPKALTYLKQYFSTDNVIAKTLDGKDFSIVIGDDFKLPGN